MHRAQVVQVVECNGEMAEVECGHSHRFSAGFGVLPGSLQEPCVGKVFSCALCHCIQAWSVQHGQVIVTHKMLAKANFRFIKIEL